MNVCQFCGCASRSEINGDIELFRYRDALACRECIDDQEHGLPPRMDGRPYCEGHVGGAPCPFPATVSATDPETLDVRLFCQKHAFLHTAAVS